MSAADWLDWLVQQGFHIAEGLFLVCALVLFIITRRAWALVLLLSFVVFFVANAEIFRLGRELAELQNHHADLLPAQHHLLVACVARVLSLICAGGGIVQYALSERWPQRMWTGFGL